MQQPQCVGFSPGISFDIRRSLKDFLKVVFTEPTVNWWSIEESYALTVAAAWIAADSVIQRLFFQEISGDRRNDKLVPLCSSPLPFELRSVVRLPQGFCGNPSHQHDTQPCDRAEHSEHQAVICMLGNRIHMLFAARICATIRPHDCLANRIQRSLLRFSSLTFLS